MDTAQSIAAIGVVVVVWLAMPFAFYWVLSRPFRGRIITQGW